MFRVAAFDRAPAMPSLRTMRRRVRASSLLAVAAVCGTILALGVGWWDWAGQKLAAAEARVAILPFVNLGDDAITERLAAGITQDIVTDLTRFTIYGERAIAALTGAGTPKCARIGDLPKLEPARRLAECEGERTSGER